jgi:hypothetical protein
MMRVTGRVTVDFHGTAKVQPPKLLTVLHRDQLPATRAAVAKHLAEAFKNKPEILLFGGFRGMVQM